MLFSDLFGPKPTYESSGHHDGLLINKATEPLKFKSYM